MEKNAKKKIGIFFSLFVITTMLIATNTIAFCEDSTLNINNVELADSKYNVSGSYKFLNEEKVYNFKLTVEKKVNLDETIKYVLYRYDEIN